MKITWRKCIGLLSPAAELCQLLRSVRHHGVVSKTSQTYLYVPWPTCIGGVLEEDAIVISSERLWFIAVRYNQFQCKSLPVNSVRDGRRQQHAPPWSGRLFLAAFTLYNEIWVVRGTNRDPRSPRFLWCSIYFIWSLTWDRVWLSEAISSVACMHTDLYFDRHFG
jgi:hypothetical protein